MDTEQRWLGSVGAYRQYHVERGLVDALVGNAGYECPLNSGAESGHRRRVEEPLDSNVGASGGSQQGDGARGDDRVAAEVEEAVVGADPFDPEDIGEHVRDWLFDRGRRCAVLACLKCGGWQRLSVEFAVRGERERVEADVGGGNHVRR